MKKLFIHKRIPILFLAYENILIYFTPFVSSVGFVSSTLDSPTIWTCKNINVHFKDGNTKGSGITTQQ
jgi:hypothetical protein